MNEIFLVLLALIAGVVLGLVFFGGLWLTTAKGISSRYPFLWFLGSLLLRTAIVLAGFYYVSGGEFVRLLACLAGFILVRFVIIRKIRKQPEVYHD